MQYLSNLPRPLAALIIGAVCLSSGSGCGGSKDKIVGVTGTVTHNGNPVEGIVVSFVPEAQTDSGVSTGTTDANGHYTLTVAKTGKSGAVAGMHRIWISRPRAPFAEPANKEEVAKLKKLKKAPAASEKPPADLTEMLKRYGNLENSQLTAEVTGGTIDLDLK